MPRKCQISKRKANNGYTVSHSHIRTKKMQNINLQKKKIWSSAESKWVKMRVSTRSMKSRHRLKL